MSVCSNAWISTLQHTENCLQNCNVLEKVINFAHVHEYNDMPVSIKVEEVRSRHAKYVYGYSRLECRSHEYKRDREPSRVPENMLKRLSQKNKKLQGYVWSCLRKNVPKSSKIHRFIKHSARRQKSTHKIAVRFVQKMRRKPIVRPRKINSLMKYGYNSNKDKHGKKYFKYFRLFSYNFPHSEYKNVTHKGNCARYRLSNDIEKNPGPLMHGVDRTKTVQAPYSQGDVHVFGQNAGRQCVVMSLCALIHHNTKRISNSGDLKQIMHIGNQLYSSLSQVARCSYLLLTELPTMLTVAEENFPAGIQ